jgi:hypothetical protein
LGSDIEFAAVSHRQDVLPKKSGFALKANFSVFQQPDNTNAINILTPHAVIASPKGVAISSFMGLLRRPAKRETPRNDKLVITFVLAVGIVID